MTDTKQWYVLGLAALIITGLGIWWGAKTNSITPLFYSGSASTTQETDLPG